MKAHKTWFWTAVILVALVAGLVGTALAHGEVPGIVRGAQMYDNWWKTLGVEAPTGNHPLYPAEGKKSGAETWRCKECHGWDYMGKDGAYSEGSSHYTGIKGVMDVAGQPVEEIVKWLDGTNNPDHNFAQFFNDEQAVIDLATFLSEGLFDASQIIDYATKAAISGNAEHGKELFETCAACHGVTGQQLNFGSDEDPEFVGTVASGNPWEFLHKVRAGQPATEMPAALAPNSPTGTWTAQDFADLIAYASTLPTEPIKGNVPRGGLLYDKWWKVIGADAPTETHPLYPAEGKKSGADTWRCKECHGWDYKGKDGAYGEGSSHYTGIKGVIGVAGQPVEEIVKWLDGTNNADHDFSTVMSATDLEDLAAFLSAGLADDALVIDYASKAFVGDEEEAMEEGEELFEAVCAACHGMDGTAIVFGDEEEPEFIGTIANDNPWEFIHKVRFGQPGTEMPSGYAAGWGLDEAADVWVYATTLPTEKVEVAGDVVRGGAMYDKWWKVLGIDPPEGDMPLWATQTTNTRSGADTWRCKECHGWDYKGKDGAYGEGSSHYTGFPGVLGVSGQPVEEIVKWLDGTNNADHDFSAWMSETDMADMAAFLSSALIDTNAVIDPETKAIKGDVDEGKELFEAVCAACHGPDGTAINFAAPDEEEFIGTIANDNPWELLHKVRFGQPGEEMPAVLDPNSATGAWSLEEIAEVMAYAQTLPAGAGGEEKEATVEAPTQAPEPTKAPAPTQAPVPTEVPAPAPSGGNTGLIVGAIILVVIIVGGAVWYSRKK